MNNIDIFSLLPVVIVAFVLLIVLLVILRRIFVNVGAREIAFKERRGAACRRDAWWRLRLQSPPRVPAACGAAPFLDRDFARAHVHKDAPQNDEQHDQKNESNYHDGKKRKDVDVIHGLPLLPRASFRLGQLVHCLALPAASSSRRALASVRFKTKPAPELLVREESTQNSPSNKVRSSSGEISASFRARHSSRALSTIS